MAVLVRSVDKFGINRFGMRSTRTRVTCPRHFMPIGVAIITTFATVSSSGHARSSRPAYAGRAHKPASS